MPRRNRELLTFSLSFLDVMSVGLGSVILIFLIINHATEVRSRDAVAALEQEVEALEGRFDAREATAEALASALERREQALSGARARLAELSRQLARAAEPAPEQRVDVERLAEEVRGMERELASLKREQAGQARAESVLSRPGEGRRQYLTGLDMHGERMLILLDVSASMLAETIVESIRLRNMDSASIRSADKWRRALDATAWLAAQIPLDSRYQLYVFNEQTRSVVPDSTGRWLDIDPDQGLTETIERMRAVRPGGGTSLINAFSAAAALDPPPSGIVLITDHTPTVGASGAGRGRIGPRRRRELFGEAFQRLPPRVPVNVVLLPMEGDPMAASLFWQLSQVTGGVLIAPTRDWP